MYGVSKLSTAGNIMMISFSDVPAAFMAQVLARLAEDGIVVDMICQTAPAGGTIRFGFTVAYAYFDAVIKTLGAGREEAHRPSPMISSGFSKINLYGEEMVESVGVAARVLAALAAADVEVFLITTSDLDISLLVRCEDEDLGVEVLKKAYELT